MTTPAEELILLRDVCPILQQMAIEAKKRRGTDATPDLEPAPVEVEARRVDSEVVR